MKRDASGFGRIHELPFDPHDKRTLRYWNTTQDRMSLLERIKHEVREAGWRIRPDSGWSGWDMEIYGSRYVKVRVTTATEHHDGRGFLTRVRVQLLMSTFCRVLMFASCVMAGLLFLYVWPFSRPAMLIPLAIVAMYLVNKWRVSTPVLGLIDEAAEKAGFDPIAVIKPQRPALHVAPDEDDLEDAAPAM